MTKEKNKVVRELKRIEGILREENLENEYRENRGFSGTMNLIYLWGFLILIKVIVSTSKDYGSIGEIDRLFYYVGFAIGFIFALEIIYNLYIMYRLFKAKKELHNELVKAGARK